MDKVTDVFKTMFLWVPLELLSKAVEKMGVLYGLMEYPFHKGKQRASKVYDNLDK